MTKNILLIISFFIAFGKLSAQNLHDIPADKIIATVGSRYIAMSDVDNYFGQLKTQNDTIGESAKCDILLNMITQKELCELAARDSIMVSDEEVERELDDRIQQNMRNFGSKEQMEAKLGKSIYQIKEEYREEIKEQLISMRMQQNVVKDVFVTPEEVRQAYDSLSKGDLPFINATVEIGQIIINPKPSPEVEAYTKNKMEELRQEIVTGEKDFSIMAGIYSEDPGSRDQGGLIIMNNKDDFDPVFASTAFRLKEGEVSPVIRSSFGYHIIKLEKKTASTATVRHILMIPAISSVQIQETIALLDSVKQDLDAKKLTYNEAVNKVSNDKIAKTRSGMMFNFQDGSSQLLLDDLDPQTLATIQNMKVGEYSNPEVFSNPYSNYAKGVRILYLKNRVDPHKANIETDYTLFKNFTLKEKQNKVLREYVYKNAATVHLRIDPSYKGCENLKPFFDAMEKQ